MTKKLENSMKMLAFLKKENGIVKRKTIATMLGLENERSISYYKDTLKFLGYNIVSHGGYNGGYELLNKEKLNDEELTYLKEVIPKKANNLFLKIKRINQSL
jgi:predicted DNA-binding transcriptional regulator YafY